MTDFGTRLRAERHRLDLTQVEFAELGGVKKNAQIDYEKGSNSPSAEYLARLAVHGVDINFLFYGEYANIGASRQVTELLNVLTQLPPPQQAMGFSILSMLRRSAAPGQNPAENADDIWRAARLVEKFLGLSNAGKTVVEKASTIED